MKTFDKMERRVAKAIKASNPKQKVRVIYSAYKSDKDDEPIDNLDEIAAKGKVVLVQEADEFWGGPSSKPYRSPVLENPTWLQVAVCANEMIETTRDGHHVFLEGLYKGKREGDVMVYEFAMGS